MPGVNPPNAERLLAIIGQLQRDVAATSTQQQQTITDSQGRPLINLGLVPGSNPARYGLQVVDPTTGNELAFIGEDATGTNLTLSVKDPNTGAKVLYVGNYTFNDGSGRMESVIEFRRADDGSIALALGDFGTAPGHTFRQALQWYDRAGNIVVADDDAGHGLARPHLPLGTLVGTDVTKWPGGAATSWTTIANGYIEYQNPNITWTIGIFAAPSTTTQFRLMLGSTQLGSTQTISNNTVSFWSDTQPWPSGNSFGDIELLQLEVQNTSGTGAAAGQCVYLSGTQA